ncbi:MAG: AtpZ/AtpI family protein [Chloroflexi bacterium]|nr:AtpZ/AtpI family protein [Chloroflexota bacterium]
MSPTSLRHGAESVSQLPPKHEGSGSNGPSTILLLGRLAGFGWFVAVSIAGGAIAGVWLDKQLDSSPVFVLTGLVLGVAVAAVGLAKLLRAFGTEEIAEKEADD